MVRGLNGFDGERHDSVVPNPPNDADSARVVCYDAW